MYTADDSTSQATLPAGSICVYARLQFFRNLKIEIDYIWNEKNRQE